ncbi:MAG: proprotein convertase P-domain protein, partial [Chloracidobacterium sp. CP2_5A]
FNSLSGASVNGTWELYVQDFVSGDSGNINGGWSLTIETGTQNCFTTACLTNVNPQVQLLMFPSGYGSLFGCPGYPFRYILTGQLTNTGTNQLSNIAIQVKGLGFPDLTNPNNVILASPNPHRLASADDYIGPCAFSGGQAGSIQTTLNGKPPFGSNTPIATLNPGEIGSVFFRIHTPNTQPIRFLVDVLAIVGPAPTTAEEVEAGRQVIGTMAIDVVPEANGKLTARVVSYEPAAPQAKAAELPAPAPTRTLSTATPGRR